MDNRPHRMILLALIVITAACGAPAEEDEEVDPTLEVYDEGRYPPIDGKADGAPPTYVRDPLPPGADLSLPLQSLFGPDEPLVTLELELIDRVMRARRADPRTFMEGANPYRVRYAVYNLRNAPIYTKLADAHAAGVDVQILIDSQQLDPGNPYNVGDEFLVARGFELVRDHKTLTDATRRTADLIGVRISGLMHLKARLFETPTERSLLTGSFNPGDESIYNEENYQLIRDARIIDRFAAAYDSLLRAQPIPNVWTEGQPLNVLFAPEGSGPRAASQLFAWLDAEREQILLMVFALRNITAPGDGRTLADLLIAKAKAGVPVWVIVDKKQSDGVEANGWRSQPDDKTEDRLRAGGVHVYEVMNNATQYTAMHHKVAILGRTNIRVITDSANWTDSALGTRTRKARNVEAMLFIDSARLDGSRTGRRYLAQWLRVLERWAQQSAPAEPPYATVYGTLTQKPGWPAQALSFALTGASVAASEEARVVGDRPELSAWETVGLGPVLAASGTEWRGGTVRLPLGTGFAYRFAVGRPGQKAHRLEGQPRSGRAMPSLLRVEEPAFLRGTWLP